MKKNIRLLIQAGIIVAIAAGVVIFMVSGLSKGMKVPIDGIDISNTPDGDYIGSYKFKRWSNTVVVHIKDHFITAIDIENDVAGSLLTDCSEELFKRVIEAQDTTVDTVSGATVTSKAYLKAIEDALHSPR